MRRISEHRLVICAPSGVCNPLKRGHGKTPERTGEYLYQAHRAQPYVPGAANSINKRENKVDRNVFNSR
jgi:hypothetical protein